MLDPAWEDELRQGQEAEGEAGSVEAELAIVHLLRHVREPDALAPDHLDNLWKQIEAEVAPAATPWWKRAWLLWAAPIAVTAAVLLVIVLPDQKGESNEIARQDQKAERAAPNAAPPAYAQKSEERARGALEEAEAAADEAPAPASAGAAPAAEGTIAGAIAARSETAQRLEKSFVKLAPYGRASIRVSVDTSYDDLRGQLLADAKGGG